MNPLQRLESLLRETFELPVWALGGQRLHPAQLGALLEDAMRDGRVGLAAGTFVPERYVLLLHPDDVRRFGDLRAEVERGLAQHLESVLQAEGYHRRAPLEIALRADEGVRPGGAAVDASFVEERTRPPALRLVPRAGQPEPLSVPPGATIPMDRRAVPAAAGLGGADPSSDALAVLAALDDEGREGERYGIAALPCVIGRSPECDLVILDLRVSRRHARIVGEDEALVLEDLDSANGVWVNGEPVGRAALADGDTVALGGPRFRVHLRA